MRWLTPCGFLALVILALPHAQATATFDTVVQPRETPLVANASTPVGDFLVTREPLPADAAPTHVRAPPQRALLPMLALDAPGGLVALRTQESELNASDPAMAKPDAELNTRDVTIAGTEVAGERVIDGLRVRVSGDGSALTPEDHRELRKMLLQFARGAGPRQLLAEINSVPLPRSPLDVALTAQEDAHATATSAPLMHVPDRAASDRVAPPPTIKPWLRVAAFAAGAAILALVGPWALYHRLRGKRTLEQDKRAALMTLLRERPGISPSDIARVIDLDPSTVRYHLYRLVKEGLVIQEGASGRHARYFAPGTTAASQRPGIAVATSQGTANVLAVVRGTPGLTMTEISTHMALGRSTISWHLRKLALARLVRLEREGRVVRVLPEADRTPMST